MKNIFTENVDSKSDPRFTGQVIQKTIVSEESSDFRMFYVQFLKGARTFVHSHDSDQILVGIEGKGILVFLEKIDSRYAQKEDPILLQKGDTVVVPKGIPHYHGSNDKSETFGHIAILQKDAESFWEKDASFPLK